MENDNYHFVSGHSVAPYNFVSLPSKCVFPYKNVDSLPAHNDLNNELLNGFIEYEIVNKTPLIIGSSEKEKKDNLNLITFFKNPKGEYVIPGNTIRGALRNNTTILSLGSLNDLIEDARFYFRSFGKGKTRKDYYHRINIETKNINGEQITAPHAVYGGYIYKDSEHKYVLVPSKTIENNSMSYFIIREQYLRKMNPKVKINYMYSDRILDLIDNKDKYRSENNRKNREKTNLLKDSYNRVYKPYCTEISFDIIPPRNISRIGKPGEYKYEGYLMSSEYIQGKLAHYVIPKPDFERTDKIDLCEADGTYKFIDFYNNDLVRTKKRIYPNKSDSKDKTYFALPELDGKENGKPIFYGKFNDKIYFGFSPYLRIPYDFSIKDLIPYGYKTCDGLTYVEAIFGFINKGEKKSNYKGRISFEDAIGVNCIEDKEYRLIAGQPHASSYPSYLMQDSTSNTKEIKNYNNDNTRIRGIKQYWAREKSIEAYDGKDNVSLLVRPLKIGTTFKGKIHFNNLKKEELGLVLWALKVNDNAIETLGYGKPYGFGQVSIENIKVNVEDIHKKYSSMIGEYLISLDRNELVRIYKNNFNNEFEIDLNGQKSIKEFKILKTLVVGSKYENELRYMQLQFPQKDYKGYIKKTNEFNELLPLPTPYEFSDILGNKLLENESEDKPKKNDNSIDSKIEAKSNNITEATSDESLNKLKDYFNTNKNDKDDDRNKKSKNK